jgi:hypothetical protein
MDVADDDAETPALLEVRVQDSERQNSALKYQASSLSSH